MIALNEQYMAREIDSRIPPEMWRAFYPRKYSCPGGYGSPKMAARVFALHCKPAFMRSVVEGRPVEGGVDAHIFVCGGVLASLGVPTYWVARDLAAAAAHTSPPESLKLGDIKFPMDGMLFVLPEGTLDPPGARSSWLAVAKARSRAGGESVCFVTGGFGPTYSVTLKAEEPLASFDSLGFETVSLDGSADPGGTTVEDDTRFTKRMAHMGTTIIMLMTARPELVSRESPVRPAGEDGRDGKKLFSPNWIGKGYRVSTKGVPAGTHASPYMHWRRGHWRHQPCGPKRSERKDIWLEPCLVGGEHE